MNKSNTKFNIAIDGHSSSGKSTIAKGLAKKLSYKYVDTGAMYRAVTLKILNNQLNSHDLTEIKKLLQTTAIDFYVEGDESYILLDGVNVENEIRDLRISEMVSEIAAIPEVREFLVLKQKEIATQKGVIMDGRDIGTVIMTDADFKFFITAAVKVRAKRRYEELVKNKKNDITLSRVLENLKLRDHIDSSRDHSPLKIAEDAIIIDTTDLTIEGQLDLLTGIINKTQE
jgi:cytidylate kinase